MSGSVSVQRCGWKMGRTCLLGVITFKPAKRLLFARVVMRFEVERQPWKLALSVMVSSLTPLWSVMSEWEVATQVGAEVRPEVVETEE
jgi:hypothetical protein